VSLAVSVDEVHELSNFTQGVGFEPVFSLNLFEPFFHFERMHGESTFLPPFRKHPTIGIMLVLRDRGLRFFDRCMTLIVCGVARQSLALELKGSP
jgi:hypothetical protein